MDPVEQETTQRVKGMRVQLKVSDRERKGRKEGEETRTELFFSFILLHCRIEKRGIRINSMNLSISLLCIQEWQEGRITQEWEGKRQGVTDTSCKEGKMMMSELKVQRKKWTETTEKNLRKRGLHASSVVSSVVSSLVISICILALFFVSLLLCDFFILERCQSEDLFRLTFNRVLWISKFNCLFIDTKKTEKWNFQGMQRSEKRTNSFFAERS